MTKEYTHEKNVKLTKTEKIIELMSRKHEDVEFSALESDMEDVEALRRSEAADKRQIKMMNSEE